jgi:hypothetical protein
LYADPVAWYASEEVPGLEWFAQYSLYRHTHQTAEGLVLAGQSSLVVENLHQAHLLHMVGEDVQTGVLAAALGISGWAAGSSKPRIIHGYEVRVDWESAGTGGNVHVTIDGDKIRIHDPFDLGALPRKLRKDPWIQREVQNKFNLMTEFER